MTLIYKILISIITFYTIFALPFKAGTFFLKDTHFEKSTISLPEVLKNSGIFLICFWIAGQLLSVLLNIFAPTQSAEVTDLIQTIVSGDTFTIWDIISVLLFSGFSFGTIHETLFTIVIMIAFVITLSGLIIGLEPLAKPLGLPQAPAFLKPFDLPLFFIGGIAIIFLITYYTTPNDISLFEFFKFLIVNMFKIIDKAKLTRAFGITLTAVTGIKIIETVTTIVTQDHSLTNRMGKF